MWMAAGVVWQFECDGSAGELDEGEGGLGAVESVGAADDQPDLVVEAFVAAVGQAAGDGGVDAGAVFADRAGGLDELGDAAALGAGAPAVRSPGFFSSAQRAPLNVLAMRLSGSLRAACQTWRRSASSASPASLTTWKGSKQISACG